MAKLDGKKAIVTGGAKGIGLATAKRLIQEGCDVTIWDYDEKEMLNSIAELKALEGGRVFAYKCDVADKKRVFTLVEQAKKDMGQIDILINNAGIGTNGRFCDLPVEEWDRLTAVNLNSIYYTTHAILPDMYKRNSGHIVNISSAAGTIGTADLAVYCATKWAVWGFTESLRHEAKADKKNKICFTSIHPHFLKEGLFKGGHLSLIGELMVPRIKSHDVVAKAIVKKALKKKRNTVKIPITLQITLIFRGLLPDSVLFFLATTFFGLGSSMKDWVGYSDNKL